MNGQMAIIAVALLLLSVAIIQRKCDEQKSQHFVIGMTVVYAIGLLWVTLISRHPSSEAVLVLQPRALQRLFQIDFRPDGGLASVKIGAIYQQTWLNIVLFVPMGYLLPFRLRQPKLWNVLAIGAAISLLIETVQLLTHLGWFDVDDIFLNTLGALLGYGLYKVVFRKPRND